jgi:hypothetical protein
LTLDPESLARFLHPAMTQDRTRTMARFELLELLAGMATGVRGRPAVQRLGLA